LLCCVPALFFTPMERDLVSAAWYFFHRNLALRKAIILVWHAIGVCLSYYLAFLLRFDGDIPQIYMRAFTTTILPLLVISTFVFAIFRLYSGIWAYFSIHDVLRIVAALGISFMLFWPAVWLAMGRTFVHYPRSAPIIAFLLLGVWTTGCRLVVRSVREHRALAGDTLPSNRRALIVGNLADANNLIQSIPGDTQAIGRIVGVVTDESERHHLTLRGILVKGAINSVGDVARATKADTILILPPYTRPANMSRIVAACEEADVVCDFRMIPSVADLAAGRIELSTVKKVEIEDLLGRPEIKFDRESVREMIAGKNVMVTGAGGSIGAELVRQVAHYSPARLVLLDNSEFNLYSIDMALRARFPNLPIAAIAGDVGCQELLRRILREHEIKVIIHAAAYKHVPLMETNVAACITNNTIGTARLAAEAEDTGVERFVLVSTDKAVRPTSVMGASKRLAERIIQERPKSSTTFVTVRFGNVLGSSGSVIPLFRKQIESGGPVTVTTEKATRFFMSIPEAVDLMLQAATIGKDREIMVLEMGESIRVLDMARRLIELSGLRVDEDIEIVFTGLRPGEKEYEEIMTDDENVVRTSHEKIWVMQSRGNHTAPPIDLDRLNRLVSGHDDQRLRDELLRLIPDADPAMAKC